MVTHETRRATRRAVTHEHMLQLFDTPDSLGSVVSAFLYEGWDSGEHLLVMAKPRHWTRIAERLARRGCTESEALEQGRLTVLDVQAVLPGILRGRDVDAAAFRATVGALVARLAHRSTRNGLRIYGELVEVLAEEGNYESAREVEHLWNQLREQQPFTLLCGYSAAHFTGPAGAPALRAICDLHTRVQRNASDLLGSWLLNDERAEAADAG
jgi:hypothetical protein